MNATDLYFNALDRADGILRRALEGLTVDELRAQPSGEGSNPIGWMVWHMTWVRDYITAGVTGEPSLWEADGWHERFGMEARPPRFTPENVHTFDPKDPETLAGYFEAVAEKTAAIVRGLSPDDLDRLLPPVSADRPPQSVGSRLGAVLNDNIQHVGQIAYLRGVIREQGWF
ncbi:MAG: DinB family protein [Chloroflexota bacterium]|nr:DinB family protein [Chloroflexota bacterium]MDE2886370.1 DinB family protein [Chloroflexota bacterium]